MQNSQTPKKRIYIPGVDYSPATLQKGKNQEWRIVFYCYHPEKKRLERIRKRVKAITSSKARAIYANKIILEINRKLQEGWNPYIEQENVNAFNSFKECLDGFIKRTEKLVKDKSLRPDTLRAYTSYIKNIEAYMLAKKIEDIYVISFNKKFVSGFLDWIYFDRRNSPTTHNNHLQFLKTLSNYLLQREFIAANPTEGITKLTEQEKKRILIPREIRTEISEYLQKENDNYLTLCLMTFFCLVRRTELTKMKVKDIKFNEDSIFIGNDISKSTKDDFVTIPEAYKERLIKHTENAAPEMYVFGANFKPGYVQLKPKKISDVWDKMRTVLGFDKRYQFYSLKDTGITEMLENGTPSVSVKNQARHSEISITEKYYIKKSTTDSNIKSNYLSF